jgi:hypothetical protein
MNYVVLFDFFAELSLPTLVIAIISAVIQLLLEKFLSKKLGEGILTFLPFAVSIILHFAYASVFIHRAVYFGEDTTALGMISGSISMGISVLYKKLRDGNFTGLADGLSLVIEGILKNYVRSDVLCLAVLAVRTVITEALDKDEYDLDALIDSVADAVKEYADDKTTDQDRKAVATLAVEAVRNLKNK